MEDCGLRNENQLVAVFTYMIIDARKSIAV